MEDIWDLNAEPLLCRRTNGVWSSAPASPAKLCALVCRRGCPQEGTLFSQLSAQRGTFFQCGTRHHTGCLRALIGWPPRSPPSPFFSCSLLCPVVPFKLGQIVTTGENAMCVCMRVCMCEGGSLDRDSKLLVVVPLGREKRDVEYFTFFATST